MNERPDSKTRCRQIREDDLDALAELLERGFPGRSRAYWRAGLDRHGARPAVADCPRFGFMLEAGGRPVGAILLIHQFMPGADGRPRLRCNLSSWFVEPEYRVQAPLLIAMAMRRKDVTYVNISPAPHTWRTIEAQSFVCYSEGQFLAIPVLSGPGPAVRVTRVGAGRPAPAALPEAGLLEDHAALGCLSLVVSHGGTAHPFAFLPFRLRSGAMPTPILQLVYCRAIEDFVRFAGPIGRFLLSTATCVVMLDATGPVPGLVGRYRHRMSPKYFRGPDAPRLGDLAYTERVVYGP